MPRRLYIETVGCQMNVLDSELVAASLRRQGYELVHSPQEADTILFNTCSVRQHAEDKIYSALGRLKHAKERHPEKIIGVLGCMAQKDQELVFRRAPYVDLVVGPGQLHQIPRLLAEIAAGSGPRMEVSLDRRAGSRSEVEQSFESYDPLREPALRTNAHQAYVRVMMGCDKFCTYCIVPQVRGPEQSRPPSEIEAEARRLVAEGCVEITLLGQTVNSYKYREGERTVRLSDLLYRLHDLEGLARLKFVTNFPNDMTDDLLAAVRDLPKVARYLHVPAQSGSNRVLARMKRLYTVERYLEMLDRIHGTVPSAGVTSDFIVGFSGETDEDFAATVDLVRRARFKNSFIFKYSPRPGTKGYELYPDDVPDEVKRRRNNELLHVQAEISHADNQPFVGRVVEILVEGPSKVQQKQVRRHGSAGEDGVSGEEGSAGSASFSGLDRALGAAGEPPSGMLQLAGRTTCDRIVVFEGEPALIGRMVNVVVYEATAFTLFGALARSHAVPEVYAL